MRKILWSPSYKVSHEGGHPLKRGHFFMTNSSTFIPLYPPHERRSLLCRPLFCALGLAL
jgi:hypothetical protein